MPCGVHPCGGECHEHCGHCSTFVEVRSPCGHDVRIVCRDSANRERLKEACNAKVEAELFCGHVNLVGCFQEEEGLLHADMCEQLIELTCSSGHTVEVKCPLARSLEVNKHCTAPTTVVLHCLHEEVLECNKVAGADLHKLTSQCELLVDLEMSCGHVTAIACRERSNKADRKICRATVQETLACGHEIFRPCSEEARCMVEVSVEASCGHTVVTECFKKDLADALLKLCMHECSKVLACGHQCSGGFFKKFVDRKI